MIKAGGDMRGIVTCSGLVISMAMIIIIHCVITGNNIRRMEVNRGTDTAMDYAYDSMYDIYADINFTQYDESHKNEIVTNLMHRFCETLRTRIKSDGNIEVRLIYADLERGLFQIGVTQEYGYSFGNKRKSYYYEKTYSFN